MAFRLFVSYSHKDRALCEKFFTHLSNLRNQKIIEAWYDGDIVPGTEWEKQIVRQIATADIIVLLISADFLASSFCFDREMTKALARHDANEARVVPVILRPVDWHGAPFDKLQMLPSGAKPVVLWGSVDEAFANVVQGIRRAIADLQALKAPSASIVSQPALAASRPAPAASQLAPQGTDSLEALRVQQNVRWTVEQLKKLQARSSALTSNLQDLEDLQTRGRIDAGRYLALKADLKEQYKTLLGQVRAKLEKRDEELDALLFDANVEDPEQVQDVFARLAQLARLHGLPRPLVETLSRQQGSLIFWFIEVGIRLIELPR